MVDNVSDFWITKNKLIENICYAIDKYKLAKADNMMDKEKMVNTMALTKDKTKKVFNREQKLPSDIKQENYNAAKKQVPAMTGETIKKVNMMPVSGEYVRKLAVQKTIKTFLNDAYSKINKEIQDKLDTDGYIRLTNYPTMLMRAAGRYFLVDDYEDINECPNHYTYNIFRRVDSNLIGKRPNGYIFAIPTERQLRVLRDILTKRYGKIVITYYSDHYRYMCANKDTGSYNSLERYYGYDIYISELLDDCKDTYLKYIIENGFDIKFSGILGAIFKKIQDLYEKKLIEFKGNNIVFALDSVDEIYRDLKIDFYLSPADVKKTSASCKGDAEAARIAADILAMDTVRADIKEYDSMMVEDPNRGSWELWDAPFRDNEMVECKEGLYARDPRMDIVDGGIVGIDFGTKSTVVVAQDDSENITPMRIGMGRYEKAPSAKDYENPTVMEFINIEDFLADYSSGEGRPHTKWSDVTSSHTAFNDWQANDKSEFYFSFFGELKQWAGDGNRSIRIRDKQGNEINLPPYDRLKESDFDPIELYAYYIGLYINNMYTRKIYMEYILSFPVTYSLEIRNRILESFRKGLSRSLPQTVLLDTECMEQFSVEQGVGEPAAYAVCALQEYGLKPKDNEKIVYGIFDFGGGTTDFDYGIWRKASGPKERRYRNVVEHFGDGGDQFLGGENLLELLSYEVFKNNQDVLRKEEITFCKPSECDAFPGGEFLLDDSQEARTNMRQMMEVLRPLWEEDDEKKELFDNGTIKVRLFSRKGEMKTGIDMQVNVEALKKLLHNRIQKGVQDFLYGLTATFNNSEYEDALKNIKKVHVFLAGNSSKSNILKEVFEAEIKSFVEALNKNCRGKFDDNFIVLYPPLGTNEAVELQKQLLIANVNDNSLERPTGKTGVAIGLVQCRKGSKIKVVSEKKAEEEIKFRYYVGYNNDDGFLEPLITRSSNYNEWVEYYDAGVDRFEFYYTMSTAAEIPNGMLASDAKKSRQKLPKNAVNEEWMIYLRAVGPDVVEYVVAEDEDALRNNNFKYGPVKVDLGE